MEYTRIAIITGAGSGIGRDAALALARSGYRVYATMRRESQRDEIRSVARDEGLEPLLETLLVDVTNSKAIENAKSTILAAEEQRFVEGEAPMLCVINNAGYGVIGTVEELGIEAYRKQMETNFFGAVEMTKAFLPLMRENGAGRIIQISSAFGRMGAPLMSAYNASKFALEGFSEALRHEVLRFNVFVSLVEPGLIATAFNENADYDRPQGSPYESIYARADQVSSAAERFASKPEDVTRAIQKIIESRYPSLRYEVGLGSHLAKFSNQFAPPGMVETVFRFF